jgi:hypothetical protein
MAKHSSPASPASPHRAFDDPRLAPFLDAGGRRMLVEKFRNRILEDDDLFFPEEGGSINIQHWHCFPPGQQSVDGAIGDRIAGGS